MSRPPAASAASVPVDTAAPPAAALLSAVGEKADRAAFAAIFDYYAPRLKSYYLRGGLSQGDAEELVQDTMLTVWQKAGQYDPQKAAPSTWIFTLARNKRIDWLRRLKAPAEGEDTLARLPDEDRTPADTALIEADDAAAVRRALDALPPGQADILRRAYFDGLSQSDIAAATGLPLGTVKSRMRLAMERLRGDAALRGAQGADRSEKEGKTR